MTEADQTGGYVRIYRRVWNNPVFRDKTEAACFVWMITMAAWKPTALRYKGRVLHLERGQLAVSVRDLAKSFGWSKSKTHRTLCDFESGTLIGTESGSGVIIITICNYEKYQPGNFTSDVEVGHPVGQRRDSSGTQNNKGKEVKEDYVISSRADARDPEPEAKAPPDPALLRSVGERILDALGADPARWMGHFGPVQAWLAAGADVDADILPTVERIGRTKPDGWCPGNLTYFDKPILQALAERNRDLSAEVVDLHPGAAPNRGPPGGLTAAEVRRRDDAAMREWEAVKRMALDEDEVNGDTAAG